MSGKGGGKTIGGGCNTLPFVSEEAAADTGNGTVGVATCEDGNANAVASGNVVGDTDEIVWVGLLRMRKNASLARMRTPRDNDGEEGAAAIDGTMACTSLAPICSSLRTFKREANSAARFRMEMLAAASLMRCDLASASTAAVAAATLSASAAA